MAKHIIKGYITYNGAAWTAEENRVGFSQWKPCESISPETVVVAEHQIEVEVPDDYDPRVSMVERLKEQKAKASAEFARTVKRIDEQIQSLLAIEHTP